MLVAALEQERQKIYQRGQSEGVEAQRQTLLRFIHWRFQTSEEDQAKLVQQLAQIDRLRSLTELSEIFLQVATLDEFTKQIAIYLPSHTPQ